MRSKELPQTLIRFPGHSLEQSLDYFIEEYGTFDFDNQILFCEVKRIHRGKYLFDLKEPLDPILYPPETVN